MDYSKLSDQDLAVLLKNGDSASYTEIFGRYHRMLLRHAFRLLNNEDEAYDVVQDVFLQLWQKHTVIEISTSLSAYLYTSVKNRIFKVIAHEKVISRYTESISRFIAQDHNAVEETILEKELTRLIAAEIAALPPKMREVFLLNKEGQLSYKEIADRLNITSETAKQQVYKAMKILKPKIEGFLQVFFFI